MGPAPNREASREEENQSFGNKVGATDPGIVAQEGCWVALGPGGVHPLSKKSWFRILTGCTVSARGSQLNCACCV